MKSGIYGIFNAIDGKVLVGSSQELKKRWRAHRNSAKSNQHPNIHFQRAWNTDGEPSFEFRVLELCPIADLLSREDYWMAYHKSLNPDFGYNLKTAFRPVFSIETRERIRQCKKGLHASAETRQKMSLAHRGKPFSAEHRAKIGLAQIGNTRGKGNRASTGRPWSEETRRRVSEFMMGNKYALGRIKTEEEKRKISLRLTGRPCSEETKRKRSVTMLATIARKRLESQKENIIPLKVAS
jgi:group I intron endonuclease